jgi:hypothetical protein
MVTLYSTYNRALTSENFRQDELLGRVVFAAGSSEGCPILWVLPLLSGAQWQSRDLAPKSDGSKCSHMVNESIVQKLEYIEQDNVLVMAGDFDYVDGTRVTNIALSRDAGTHTHNTHTHTYTHTHTHTLTQDAPGTCSVMQTSRRVLVKLRAR